MTILQPMVREVSVTPLKPDWPALSGAMHVAHLESTRPEDRSSRVGSSIHTVPGGACPVSAQPEERSSPAESSAHMVSDGASTGRPHDAAPPLRLAEERLERSAHATLRVLMLLLEAGADTMPRTLLDRLEDSCLLSDEHLHHDVDSLCRIEAVLRRSRDD